MATDVAKDTPPAVLITGAAGNIGRSLAKRLGRDYRVIGLDRSDADTGYPIIESDLTDDDSMADALAKLHDMTGGKLASVIHLAAFFDFSGEEKPQYEAVNVEGTRRLIRGLQDFDVEQFVYSSTMLVHKAGEPGETIDESQPLEPGWAYPRSKARTEQVIRDNHGRIPFVLLRLAGIYDEQTSVPTFSHQIARIYERDLQSHLYSGSTDAGQAMLHRQDMVEAFARTVDRRGELPLDAEIMVGEPETLSYDDVQDRLGMLIHGSSQWRTIRVPAHVAAAGAWAQDKAEPVIPDAIDQGERPFIRPFMVTMASDNYALDISRARDWLGWEPRHRLADELAAMVDALTSDPLGWYEANKITPPTWMREAQETHDLDPEALRSEYQRAYRAEHRQFRWAHFVNIGLGFWLLTQPVMLDVQEPWLFWSEMLLGAGLMVFAALSLSWQTPWARWICAGIGALVMAVPFVFWTGNGAAFLSDTLVGMLAFGLAVGSRPEPGPSPLAAATGPSIPPGWQYNPSTWSQRIPIIVLAVIGLIVSRYLAAYQLGQISGVWEPFFAGDPGNAKNGTEEIVTSSVSEAWPVPDAAVGGYTYALEILTGIVGSQRRWRTMPWLVILFGLMIAPLGIVSISFIIIQPIVIGTWATLTLIGAAAMLIQIPYSLDELLASCQFIRRRVRAGKSALRVFLFGDTDEGGRHEEGDEFDRPPGEVFRDMVAGGVNLPWNLWLAVPVAISLLFTRLTLGAEGTMADLDHLVGSLALTVLSVSAAEMARPARFLLIPLGLMLFVTPFANDTSTAQMIASVLCGLLLIGLSFRRGPVRCTYGKWDKLIV